MKKISYKLVSLFAILWLVYFIYSLFLTLYDFVSVDKIDWYQAKNISSSYSGYKATIVTYSYEKGNVQIARQYGYFTQGLTVWLWGIDKKADNVDISFYVKKKDYDKVINNMPSYNALWFSDKKQADTIPFFGLRKINQSPNKIILFFDLLKYNYSISLGFTIIFMPIFIVALLKKVLKNKDYQLDDIYNIKGNKYINQIFILFLFLAILRFLI
ncbi:hypothetical protein [uncultured Apibacter sp.]|uniref:hypothetical protein n=1 Tax=uncultured Apibacter sp. TaxID=1778616 RepID=UPI0025E798DB|nr:hypothetical protein [uncultured Apibacter sp.]